MPCVLTMLHLQAGTEKEQTGEPARESAYATGTMAAAGLAFNAIAAALAKLLYNWYKAPQLLHLYSVESS